MRSVLVIEGDTLIRELMREHLEREGYEVCAVASVRAGLNAARWTRFELVLLDFASASECGRRQLGALRALGAPVLMMSSAPRGMATSVEGEIEHVVWSPFDLATLTRAVRRFLPPARPTRPARERVVSSSGTYPVTRDPRTVTTLPAPPDPALPAREPISLQALGELVLEATRRAR